MDFPKPKPFRAFHQPSSIKLSPNPTVPTNQSNSQPTLQTDHPNLQTNQPTLQTIQLSLQRDKKSADMLLENLESNPHIYYSDISLPSPCSPHTNFSLPSPSSPNRGSYIPSPTSPHQGSYMPSPPSSHHGSYIPACQPNNLNYFQFPVPQYCEAGVIKDEPWTVPALDIPSTSILPTTTHSHISSFPTSTHISARSSLSPMLLSPVVSNLNTPRVSLSSLQSDFSTKLRSNHSSLQCSPHTSPLGFLDTGVGGFGHSMTSLNDLASTTMDTSPAQTGCITPPRSGYSSPLQDNMHYHHAPAPPTYEQSLQNYQISSSSQYLPPPYSYALTGTSDPSLATPFTPDPDSVVSEPPDTPDSSIKEEPSEEVGEEHVPKCG